MGPYFKYLKTAVTITKQNSAYEAGLTVHDVLRQSVRRNFKVLLLTSTSLYNKRMHDVSSGTQRHVVR
jgi:hypothetical protein